VERVIEKRQFREKKLKRSDRAGVNADAEFTEKNQARADSEKGDGAKRFELD
jgi:hypothetical protein